MIKIIAKMPVAEGKLEEFKTLAKELVEKSAGEAGNVYYTLNVSTSDPRQFAILECWKDQAAVDYHNGTEHFTGLLPKIAALCDGDITVELLNEVEL